MSGVAAIGLGRIFVAHLVISAVAVAGYIGETITLGWCRRLEKLEIGGEMASSDVSVLNTTYHIHEKIWLARYRLRGAATAAVEASALASTFLPAVPKCLT